MAKYWGGCFGVCQSYDNKGSTVESSLVLFTLVESIFNFGIFFIRPINGIHGLTREIIVALTTNIESQEQQRVFEIKNHLAPEHPRAS